MFGASWLIRLASWMVPAAQREDWRREWMSELRTVPRPWRFAIGAPWHALWLRKDGWRPALLAADLTFGLRLVRRRPGLAAASILTLGIGIGATTAIFSVVYGVLLKPLPYRDPHTLVQLWEINPRFNWTEATIAPGNLLSWRERNQSFSDIAFYFGSGGRDGGLSSWTMGGSEPMRVQGLSVSTNFFDVLGAPAAKGRTFARDEDVVGQHRVIVLSDRFWRSRFGGDPGVLGTTVPINGLPFTIVGIMPADFSFDLEATDFWLPSTIQLKDLREVRRPHYLRAIARLKPGVTVAQAQADISSIARDLERQFPETNTQMSVGLGPADDWFVGLVRRPLWLFLSAVALVLLIACANVANLLLARSLERAGEMSLRAALGASRSRLIRQMIVESLVLATLGSALGLVLATVGVPLFVRFAPIDLPRLSHVAVQPMVLAFCAAVTGLTTVLVGLMPALWGARVDLRQAIGSTGRQTMGRAAGLRRTLVVAEVALAAVLVVGAALALRSFLALVSVDPGVPVGSQASARVSLPAARYGKPGQPTMFFESIGEQLRSMPGVTAAGATAVLPLDGSSWSSQFYIEGRPDFHGYELRHKAVTVGYLEALGVRVLAGRTFTAEDVPDSPYVIVANETFARKFFNNESIVGRHITWDVPKPTEPLRTIIGVVSDEPQDGLGRPTIPEVYYALRQEERREMSILVRSSLPASQALAAIKQVVAARDPQLALYDAGAMPDRLSRSVAKPRLAAWFVGAFAGVALLLALVGIYGVTAWAVAARGREFGIRVACGATAADVFRHVLSQDLRMVLLGLGVGLALAAAGARAAGSLLYGVTAGDLASYAAGAALLLATGVAACVVPARRAARTDPARAMREA